MKFKKYLIEEKKISPSQAQKFYDLNVVPKGWYVHGRALRQDLRTGRPLLLTKDWNTAIQYAGSSGSIWMIRPKKNAKVFDARKRFNITKLAKLAEKDFYRGILPFDDDIIYLTKKTPPADDYPDIKDFIKFIEREFNPAKIVSSGGAYENVQWIDWFYNRAGYDFAVTNDGGVVINLDAVETIKVT